MFPIVRSPHFSIAPSPFWPSFCILHAQMPLTEGDVFNYMPACALIADKARQFGIIQDEFPVQILARGLESARFSWIRWFACMVGSHKTWWMQTWTCGTRSMLCRGGGICHHFDQIRHIYIAFCRFILRYPHLLVRPADIPDQGFLCDLLWSDPSEAQLRTFSLWTPIAVMMGVVKWSSLWAILMWPERSQCQLSIFPKQSVGNTVSCVLVKYCVIIFLCAISARCIFVGRTLLALDRTTVACRCPSV